jgi:hypothetical protein
MAAGVSLERTLLTVTLVFRGGGFGELASGSFGSCALAARTERIATTTTMTCRRVVKVMDEDLGTSLARDSYS